MIKEIEIKNFRNHENVKIDDFCDSINIISGKNGEGKTNILEAIYFAASGKSFRTIHDYELIQEKKKYAYVSVVFNKKIDHKIEILLENGQNKSIKIDNQNIKNLTELYKCIPAVVFSPEDIKIIKEGPSYRRKYIDLEICRIKPTYIETLKKHKYICAQKNKVLKTKNAEKMIDIFNDQLVETSVEIYIKREKYIKRVIMSANKLLEDMGKDIILEAGQNTDIINSNIENNIKEKLNKIKKRELEEKTCLFGPQRTDIEIKMNNKDTRMYASQGEAGTIAIALKFAAAEIIENEIQQKPVVLLDDVFSYLDKQRREWVMKKSEMMQTFITIAADTPVINSSNKIYFIKKGKIYIQK